MKNNIPIDVPISDARKVDLATRPIAAMDPSWIAKIRANKCTSCMKTIQAGEFRDDLSRKEYNISGMCQDCQDSVFK